MSAATVAEELSRAGYHGLFQIGERNAAPAIWGGGERRAALEEIVAGDGFDDFQRLLAAELLFRFADGFPGASDREALARIYARALALTGGGDRPLVLTANAWGFLYDGDEGPLGEHLRATGEAAVPQLAALLDDDAPLFYEGSQEATLGAELAYRVKDAAAYYIGRLTGRAVAFHDDVAERDAEIARLRASLDG